MQSSSEPKKAHFARTELLCDPGTSESDVLEAVVAYYHTTLLQNPDAMEWLAQHHLCDPALVEGFRLGYSDRSLGFLLPEKNRKSGAALRGTLTRLGVYRPSGHEHFRGCVVVPVVNANGFVVAMWGVGIRKGAGEAWANGLSGGIFNPSALAESEIVVVSSIGDALAVVAAGHEAVIAPGRASGFLKADIAAIFAGKVMRATVIADGAEALVEKLARTGIEVSWVTPGAPLTDLVACAPDRYGALTALLSIARPVESARRVAIPQIVSPPSIAAPDSDGAEVAKASNDDSGETTGANGQPDESNAAAIIAASDVHTPTDHSRPPAKGVVVSGDVAELYVTISTRRWRVRGAESAKGPSSLRVALCVTDVSSGRFHLDTFDLYQAKARAAFVVAAKAELHADPDTLRRELAEVLFATEAAIAKAAEADPLPQMTEEERTEAMELLRDPNLVARAVCDLGMIGVVGEETNLAVAYLATISRKAERPFGVIVQSSSAAGKSTLAEAVVSLVPPEELVAYSAMTDQSLYYVESKSLSHKVLFISEEAGAARASYALKLLMTDGRLSIASTGKDKATGRLRTSSYEVAGPVALVMTTTATEIDPELSNRLVTVGVDEAAEQTRAIHVAQRTSATLEGLVSRKRRDKVVALHRNAQRLIEALPVVIADAGSLDFPSTAARHRRDHMKLLSLITASALLHQHQRHVGSIEVDGTTLRYVEADRADVELAMSLAEHVLNASVDDLAPQTRRLLDAMGSEAQRRSEETGGKPTAVSFTRRELREMLGWSERQVRSGIARLVALDYVIECRNRTNPARGFTYVLCEDLKSIARRRSPLARHPGRRAKQTLPPAYSDSLAGNPPCGESLYMERDDVGVGIGIETGPTNGRGELAGAAR